MSINTFFRLQGDYFIRELSIDSNFQPVEANIVRIPYSYSKWYENVTEDDAVSIANSIDEEYSKDTYSQLIIEFSKEFGQDVAVVQLDYNQCYQADSRGFKSYAYSKENFLKQKSWKRISREYHLNRDRFLDSLYIFPVLPDSNVAYKINNSVAKGIIPMMKLNEKIVVLTGELIWSGWISLEAVLKVLNLSRSHTLLLIDSFGYLQQTRLANNKSISEIKSLLKGVVIPTKSQARKVTNKYHLEGKIFKNQSINYKLKDESYCPEYIYIDRKSTFENNSYIKLGGNVNKISVLPQAIFKMQNVDFQFPKEAILQKNENDQVFFNEDIGRHPKFSTKIQRLKFPKQINFLFNENDLVTKDQVIGVRKVLKGMLKEKYKSPGKYRIDGYYKSVGVIKYKKMVEDMVFNSPFEGQLLSIKKESNYLRVNALTKVVEFRFSYIFGKDFQLQLQGINELEQNDIDKALLIRSENIQQLDVDTIIKYRVKAIILTDCNYEDLKKLKKILTDSEKYLTILLLSGFDLEMNKDIADILYLLKGNLILKRDQLVYVCVSQRQSRELYARLSSKSSTKTRAKLVKSDQVFFFDYNVYDSYARIEKSNNNEFLITTDSGVIRTGMDNILKFKTAELEDK